MKVSNTQQTTFGNRIITFPRITSRACEKAKTMLVQNGEITLENLGPAFLIHKGTAVLVLDKSCKDSSTKCVVENYPEIRKRLRGLSKKSEAYRAIKAALGDILFNITRSPKTKHIASK